MCFWMVYLYITAFKYMCRNHIVKSVLTFLHGCYNLAMSHTNKFLGSKGAVFISNVFFFRKWKIQLLFLMN